jgi:hypothetical protein
LTVFIPSANFSHPLLPWDQSRVLPETRQGHSVEAAGGATFHVYLPLLKDAAKTEDTDTPVIHETGSERILIVAVLAC